MVQIANGYGKNILGAPLIISFEHVDGSEKSYQKKVLQHFPNLFGKFVYIFSIIAIVIPTRNLWEALLWRVNKLVLKRPEFFVASNTLVIYNF